MNPICTTFALALLLVGCVSTNQKSAVTLTPAAEYAVEKGYASKGDITAAVLAARNSRYFPGIERYEVNVLGRDQIAVLYYDPPGNIVVTKRIHNRWQAVDRRSGWQS